jgi:hypothetical protein
MRWRWVKAGVLSAVLVAVGAVAPASATSSAPAGGSAAPPHVSEAFTLVVGTVLAPPNAVLGADNRRHLAYELQLLNVAPFPVTLNRSTRWTPAPARCWARSATPRWPRW